MRSNITTIFIPTLVLGWGIAACSVGSEVAMTQTPSPSVAAPAATVTPTPTHTPPPLDLGVANFPANVNPLTGLEVEDVRLLERRPLAIKVSNDPRPMRPQWGLNLADIVYEYYTEWGKTRFVAIYYGKEAPQVGPMRSARFFDEHIIYMYKAALAFISADKRVLDHFYSMDYADRLVTESACPPICRIDPKMWNHAVTNTRSLSTFITMLGVANERQNLDGMGFAHAPPDGGEPGNKIFVRYSPYFYARWKYNSESGKYERAQDREDDLGQGESYTVLVDALSGAPVAADNVVVLLVPYDYYVKDDDTEIVTVDLWGSGEAYLFRDGQLYRVLWKRIGRDDVLSLYNQDGNPFPFKPGNTWFEVMGQTTAITQPGEGVYRFEFAIP